MNALVASLSRLIIASPATIWVQNIFDRLNSATGETPLWQHIAACVAALARKSAAVASRLFSALILGPWLQQAAPQLKEAPVFPIRVIDVEETVSSRHGNVVFRKPTSWEFHTISHTWSKGVQSWSDIIAHKMQLEQSTGAEEAVRYNDLFRREDFSWHECYPPFMEFLKLLRADGVKQVWLDALCINQGSESGEKSQELQNMGSYYAKSLGCYVCAHGFGEGFETWKEKESKLVLPRWFSRVWTFQEMLLPKKLTFIFGIHPVIRRTINWCISQQKAQGVNGPCRCAMGVSSFPEPRYLISEEEDESYETEDEICGADDDQQKDVKQLRGNKKIICGGRPCSRCGGAALIRRTKDIQMLRQQSPDGMVPDVYFIDRQSIVWLMLMAKEQLQKTVWKDADESAEWKLLRLEKVMQHSSAAEGEKMRLQGDVTGGQYGWDPIQVAVEVSKRDCTHPEDRILSILGLLGLEGAVQLRAGKSLDAQLLHLAQQLVRANPTALVKLCVAQFAGHAGTPGMSWAPTLGAQGGLRPTGEEAPATLTWKELRRHKHMYARLMQVEGAIESGLLQLGNVMRHFVRTVQVVSVMEDGSLLCEAQVLWECSYERVDGNLFNLHLTSTNQDFSFNAYFSPSSCLFHHNVVIAGQNTLTNQSMVRLEGRQLEARLHSLQVCLVLLGRLHLPINDLPIDDEKHEVMMVCVGSKADCLLHKVGLAWLPGLEKAFSTAGDPPSRVTIGGFADYMDRFVFTSH